MKSLKKKNTTEDAAPGRSPDSLAWKTGLWIATVCNWPLWDALMALPEMRTGRGLLFCLAFAGMVTAITTLALTLFAWRHVIRLAITVFVLSAAFGAYFMGTYGIVIDATMIVNTLQTDPREVRDLLSVRMMVTVGVMAGLPLWWLWRRPVSPRRWLVQCGRNTLLILGALVLAATLLLATFADMSATMRNHKSLRYRINPLNSFYALGILAIEARAKPNGPPVAIGEGATLKAPSQKTKPPLLLLVVGETARADHFSLNGYARATNPELSALGVVSFKQVMSCGTNTAASVPCMFSFLGREPFVSRNQDHENLLDLFQRLSMAVLWIDNQAGCKGVCARIPSVDAYQLAPGAPPMPEGLCEGQECFDMAMLHGLNERLAALPAERREKGVLLVLHQMGSHGPAYYLRAPKDRKPFMPECTTNVLQQCDHDALINAYDNSIAYTDHFLAQSIQWLKSQTTHFDPALLYFSDHGESLGENNLFLHGLPYAIAPKEQKHVPMIAWWPEQTGTSRGVSLSCLQGQQDVPLSHDNLFHTVTAWFDIQATEYRAELDAFRTCRRAP